MKPFDETFVVKVITFTLSFFLFQSINFIMDGDIELMIAHLVDNKKIYY